MAITGWKALKCFAERDYNTLVTYLKIIVMNECGEFFKEKIKNNISQQTSIKTESYKESEYWKDRRLLEFELTLSALNPLPKAAWEKLLEDIVSDYNVLHDKEFTSFEHFETVDMLKKGGGHCFICFNIPNGLIQTEE